MTRTWFLLAAAAVMGYGSTGRWLYLAYAAISTSAALVWCLVLQPPPTPARPPTANTGGNTGLSGTTPTEPRDAA